MYTYTFMQLFNQPNMWQHNSYRSRASVKVHIEILLLGWARNKELGGRLGTIQKGSLFLLLLFSAPNTGTHITLCWLAQSTKKHKQINFFKVSLHKGENHHVFERGVIRAQGERAPQ